MGVTSENQQFDLSLPTDFFWGKNKRNYTTLDFREFFGLSECTLENIRDFPDVHIQEFRSLNYKYDTKKMKDFRRYVPYFCNL